jgi:HSP20 family protein
MRRRTGGDWPLETLWSQELVDGMFRTMLRSFFTGASVFEGGSHPMRVEEYIEDDTCVIRAELPGIDPEKDVEISVADGVLHLSAERQERTEEERPDGFRSEFHYGSLSRSIRLPEGATEADVKATYKDGILEVRVPAPKEAVPAPPRKIPVSRG